MVLLASSSHRTARSSARVRSSFAALSSASVDLSRSSALRNSAFALFSSPERLEPPLRPPSHGLHLNRGLERQGADAPAADELALAVGVDGAEFFAAAPAAPPAAVGFAAVEGVIAAAAAAAAALTYHPASYSSGSWRT
ncbi:uncharacterized protein LOC127794813 [Diospyros lotus]|uniref:uncharacterized protein LOC127794813 n=1 Tax=Diospyros lotus TaxID=55363 RepID=UPI002253F51A|nr:uncharacterized protein LOC127794813 [Diospyros lotus]